MSTKKLHNASLLSSDRFQKCEIVYLLNAQYVIWASAEYVADYSTLVQKEKAQLELHGKDREKEKRSAAAAAAAPAAQKKTAAAVAKDRAAAVPAVGFESYQVPERYYVLRNIRQMYSSDPESKQLESTLQTERQPIAPANDFWMIKNIMHLAEGEKYAANPLDPELSLVNPTTAVIVEKADGTAAAPRDKLRFCVHADFVLDYKCRVSLSQDEHTGRWSLECPLQCGVDICDPALDFNSKKRKAPAAAAGAGNKSMNPNPPAEKRPRGRG